MRSFKAEAVLASTIAAAAMLFYSGVETFRMLGDTPTTYTYGETPAARAAKVQRHRDRQADLVRNGIAQFVIGGVLGLGSLGVGLAIAYGVGPKWLTYRVSGKVEARYVFADGQTYVDADREVIGGRCYVAIWSSEDRTLHELWCPPEKYRLFRPGQLVECRAIGRRLTRIDRTREPTTSDG